MSGTVMACLTPPGSGALATLAVRGPSAWDVVRALARRELPAQPEPGHFWLTMLGGAGKGEADEVVVAFKAMTPTPEIEIHCHGGREVVLLLEELLRGRGVEAIGWREFVGASLAGAAGSDDRTRIAALDVLTRAPTLKTAAIALDQFQGAFSQSIKSVREAVSRGDTDSAQRLLAELERYAPIGRHLVEPWRVVIAGAPNVGKSSLVNALAGYQRSIVSSIPGTTRDVVTTLLSIDGWPVEICDTAGWRTSDEELESEGIARARSAAAGADLCLWVLDASAPPVWPDQDAGAVRLVINKVDLPAVWKQDDVDAIHVSALTGTGMAQLCDAISRWLVPDVPPPGAGVPFTPELIEECKALRAGCVSEGR